MPLNLLILELGEQLKNLEKNPSFENALKAAQYMAYLLQGAKKGETKILNVTKHGDKIAGWFNMIPGLDIPAAHSFFLDLPIDFKVYWLKKTSKQRMAGAVNFTENYEDDPILFFDKNIGIDIIIPHHPDRIFIVLSSAYKLRVLELHADLTITQQEILQKWIQNFSGVSQKTIHEILWQSFNLKSLNQKFYENIARKFTELVQYLVIKGYSEHDAKHFTNRLIGRIIFLWFLRKKNIINESCGYFEPGDENYYRDKLSLLFFETLNKPIEERNHIDTITPYLNGGLFESRGIDRDAKLTFPKVYFREFYDFLAEYNFTTDESTSSFEQVAIDPEMLGRIFENLLAEQVTETGEQARKAKGAFYTPREIVDYMCLTSLKTYLEGGLKYAHLSESDQEKIFKHLFEDTDSQFALYKKNESYDAITKNRGVIIQALDNLTILDPACGSGAFPMGMMQAMIRVYERVMTDASFKPTEIKLGIIERSLFGVDIEPMAVEIARLRAWLSIIVEEPNDSKHVKPLPNLDFKFVCANSLIPLESESGQQNMFDAKDLAEKMQNIRTKYYDARTPKSKENLKQDFQKLLQAGQQSMFASKRESQLKTYSPFDAENSCGFFDPKFMFGIEEGFGVVIGNPPYFVYQGHNKSEIELINSIDLYKKAEGGKLNAFKLFLARGSDLTSDKGILSFIFQNSFLADNGSKKIREFFLNEQKIIKIDSFPERDNPKKRVFEGVKMSVCIMLSINEKVPLYSFVLNVWEDRDRNKGWSTIFENKELQEYDQNSRQIPYLQEKEKFIFKKFFSRSDIEKVKCYEGELNMTFHKKFFNKNPECPKIIKGAQIQRYFLTDKMSQGELEYLDDADYLSNNRGEKSGHHNLDRIALQGISGANDKIRIISTIVPKGYYIANSCNYIVKVPEKYSINGLLGILNSYFINWIFKKTSTNSNVNTYEISNLSFPKINSKKEEMLIVEIKKITDQILELKKQNPKADTSDLEKQIDTLVYDLYGLTEEEIKIIEGK